MTIEEGLSYDDVLLIPQEGVLSSRKDANISSSLFLRQTVELPILAANMPAVTGVRMINALARLGARGVLHRFMPLDEQVAQYKLCPSNTLVSIGVNDGLQAFDALRAVGAYNFILDVAHGHHRVVGSLLDKIASDNGSYIMVGNVATAKGAVFLEDHGADAIKVGVGPGAACTTRRVTGYGVPQLTAVMNCYEAGVQIPICADGGIKESGDIVKALAAGADTVMIGSLLAGTDEAEQPGIYYGNASRRVNGHNAPEGVEGNVPLTGPVEGVIKSLAWGIRSGISYAGARNLDELRDNARWIRCTPLAHYENGARV